MGTTMNGKYAFRLLALLGALALLVAYGCATTAPSGPMTASEMVSSAKQNVQEISAADARATLDSGGALFIDVRTEKEYRMGHVPGARNVDRGLLEFRIDQAAPDKSSALIVYCKSGGRSALATDTLQRMGYTDVQSMAGGFDGWMAAGYPVE